MPIDSYDKQSPLLPMTFCYICEDTGWRLEATPTAAKGTPCSCTKGKEHIRYYEMMQMYIS